MLKNLNPIKIELLSIPLSFILGFIGAAYFINDKSISIATGLIIGAFSTLLGIYFATLKLKITENKNILLKEIENSNSAINSNLERVERKIKLSSMDHLYTEIDNIFLCEKNNIIEETNKQLRYLINPKGVSDLIEKSVYYRQISKFFSNSKSGDEILVVSRMKSKEWEDTPREKGFVTVNKETANRGVKIHRIFISPEESFKSMKSQLPPKEAGSINAGYVIKIHSKDDIINKNILGRFADETHIEREHPQLLKNIGDGFLIFVKNKGKETEETVVVIEKFSDNDEACGVVSRNEDINKNRRELFDTLTELSDPF